MSGYVSTAAFLADVRLRLDAFRKDKLGALIVEGPDDRRLFFRHVVSLQQVIPSDGRVRLLSAYEHATAEDRRSMIFLTDCDYEVRLRTLRGAPGLVITEGTDVESDLVNLGLLHSVVGEIVPEALGKDQAIAEITEHALREAIDFARPLGRIRMAAKPLGVALHLGKVRHRQYWPTRHGSSVDVDKMIRSAHQKISAEQSIALDTWRELVAQTPHDDGMCNGKDLLRAFKYSLGLRHNLAQDIEDETLVRLLRANLWPAHLADWDVARRIRRWELATGLHIFAHTP